MEYDEYALIRVDEVFERLGTSPDGITQEEASKRLQNYGANVIPSAKKRSLASRTILQLKNAFNLLLLFAAALSFFSGYAYSDPSSVQPDDRRGTGLRLRKPRSNFRPHHARRSDVQKSVTH